MRWGGVDSRLHHALVDAWRRDKTLYCNGLSVAAHYIPVDHHFRFSFYLFR